MPRETGWGTKITCLICEQDTILYHPTRTDLNCYCSPLCKAMGMAKIDPNDLNAIQCLPYKHSMFIWNHSSYSVKMLIHKWYYKKSELSRNIVLTCPLQRCANPHHMRTRKVRQAIIDAEE